MDTLRPSISIMVDAVFGTKRYARKIELTRLRREKASQLKVLSSRFVKKAIADARKKGQEEGRDASTTEIAHIISRSNRHMRAAVAAKAAAKSAHDELLYVRKELARTKAQLTHKTATGTRILTNARVGSRMLKEKTLEANRLRKELGETTKKRDW